MGAAQRIPSFDEMYRAIAALPDGQHGEILGPGWWRTMSRPGGRHSRVAKAALRMLGSVDTTSGGDWWIDVERELVLGTRLYVPDLAGWRVGGGDLSFTEENPVTRTPDWACEILSRSTQRGDRVVKLPVYAAAGVGHVWVVDLDGESIEVYAPHLGKPLLVATLRAGEEHPLPPFDLPFSITKLLAQRPGAASGEGPAGG